MQKKFSMLFCILLAVLLCGCQGWQNNIRSDAVAYGKAHQTELEACAEELIDKLSAGETTGTDNYRTRYYKLSLSDDTLFLQDSAEERVVFESELALQLLRQGKIESICYHAEPDGSKTSVSFSCRGFGLGSATKYFGIQYVPSGAAEDLWFYQTYPFAPQNDGYYGESGDNSFYYELIIEKLFYTEAAF